MKKKRIVVTGMGLVSCFGNEVEHFYKTLLEGKSGVKKIAAFPTEEFTTKIAAEIPEFDVGDALDKKQARRVDKFIVYAMVAGKNALKMAGLKSDASNEI